MLVRGWQKIGMLENVVYIGREYKNNSQGLYTKVLDRMMKNEE